MRANIISEMTGNVYEKTVTAFDAIVQTSHKKDAISNSTVPEYQIGKIPRRSISRIQDSRSS